MAKAQAAKAADVEPIQSRISVIDRRKQNPFGSPSRDIPLKGEKRGWVVHGFTADPEHPDRHYDAVHGKGWIPLVPTDLAVSPESIGFVVSTDGRVVRGLKGETMLAAMPKEDYDAIQAAKSAANLRRISPAVNREDVAQATAKEYGSEAGDQIAKTFNQQDFIEPVA